MKRFFQAVAVYLAASFTVHAENTPVVVELFTSQGCSSCPPADELMEVLVQREDVIALSLHVDYWDYIGWKDEFADPRHAERQRAYARFAGRRSVYTPEMIVNGISDIVGAKPMALASAIEKHKAQPRVIDISVSRDKDRVAISARAPADAGHSALVHMLRYQPERTARITRGENAGKTIRYRNVVQDWQVIGKWNGSGDLQLEAHAPGNYPVVILIQSEKDGRIYAAARLP
ncbi:MAG: DUF1223 domain-containing protein [Roseobacter sp.]